MVREISGAISIISRSTEMNNTANGADEYIKFTYKAMLDHLIELSKNFYENGQQDKDLKLMTEFREDFQKAEEIMRSMLK